MGANPGGRTAASDGVVDGCQWCTGRQACSKRVAFGEAQQRPAAVVWVFLPLNSARIVHVTDWGARLGLVRLATVRWWRGGRGGRWWNEAVNNSGAGRPRRLSWSYSCAWLQPLWSNPSTPARSSSGITRTKRGQRSLYEQKRSENEWECACSTRARFATIVAGREGRAQP